MGEHPVNSETGQVSFNVRVKCPSCLSEWATAAPVETFECCNCGHEITGKHIMGSHVVDLERQEP